MEFPHFRLSGLCVLPLFPLPLRGRFLFFAFHPIVANLPSVPRTSLESFCCYFFRSSLVLFLFNGIYLNSYFVYHL